MKKGIVLSGLLISALLLQACGNQESTPSDTSTSAPVQSQEANTTNTETSATETNKQVETSPEPPKQEEVSKQESKTSLTKEEFNQMFKLDPDEKQYENGKFQLKDGTELNADYLNYGENDKFEYAATVFFEGNLVKIQVDMPKGATIEDVKNGLGIAFPENTIVDEVNNGEYGMVFDIVFDERFHDNNIAILPSEWK